MNNTGEPNSSVMRVLELEKEGRASSARTRSAHHRRVQDFLCDIDFDETRSGVFETREFDGVKDAMVAYRHPTCSWISWPSSNRRFTILESSQRRRRR